MLFTSKLVRPCQEFDIEACLIIMTHVVDRSKVLDSWSLIWKYNRFCSPKWKPAISAKGPIQSNFTLWVSTAYLPLKSHVIVKIFEMGSAFSKQKLGWNMLKQITKQHLSPNATLQEVIKHILGICTAVEVHFGLKSHLGLRRNSATQGFASCHIHSAPD